MSKKRSKTKQQPTSASIPAVPAATEEEPAPAPDGILSTAGTVWAVGFVLAVAFVYLYGTRGGPYVDRLSGRIGEPVAAQAATLAQAGRIEDAVDRYRQALELPFDDPKQFTWVSQRFGELLLQEGRAEDAAPVLREALERDPEDLKTYRLLGEALRGSGNATEALAIQERRFALARHLNKKDIMAAARFDAGLLHLALKAPDKAVDAFRESQDIKPAPDKALRIARALFEAGRQKESTSFLDYAVEHGQGSVRQEAEQLKRDFVTSVR